MSQNNEIANLLIEIEEMKKYILRCDTLATKLIEAEPSVIWFGGCLEAKLEELVERKTGEKQYHSAE